MLSSVSKILERVGEGMAMAVSIAAGDRSLIELEEKVRKNQGFSRAIPRPMGRVGRLSKYRGSSGVGSGSIRNLTVRVGSGQVGSGVVFYLAGRDGLL